MPGPARSLNIGIWSMLTVSSSPCGRAASGNGAPLPVVASPGKSEVVTDVVMGQFSLLDYTGWWTTRVENWIS